MKMEIVHDTTIVQPSVNDSPKKSWSRWLIGDRSRPPMRRTRRLEKLLVWLFLPRMRSLPRPMLPRKS